MATDAIPLRDSPITLDAAGDRRHPLTLCGSGLSIDGLIEVARRKRSVKLSTDPGVQGRVQNSCTFIQQAVAQGQIIYGVTTGFGGMANVLIPAEERDALQDNMLWYHKTGAGRLYHASVWRARGSALLRASSHPKVPREFGRN